MTAENAPRPRAPRRRSSGFNEAAADDRGKQGVMARDRLGDPRFNEAAADDRGKRRGEWTVPWLLRWASMRPRPMTAENILTALVSPTREMASMRPRPMTAENTPTTNEKKAVANLLQ